MIDLIHTENFEVFVKAHPGLFFPELAHDRQEVGHWPLVTCGACRLEEPAGARTYPGVVEYRPSPSLAAHDAPRRSA